MSQFKVACEIKKQQNYCSSLRSAKKKNLLSEKRETEKEKKGEDGEGGTERKREKGGQREKEGGGGDREREERERERGQFSDLKYLDRLKE